MRRLNFVLITGGVLLLLALAAWLLRENERDEPDRGAGVLSHAPSPAPASAFLGDGAGAPRAGAPEGLSVAATAPDSGTAADAASALATPTAPAAPDDASVAARFRGRVVDDIGVPIAGATVVYFPGYATRAIYGLGADAYGAALDVLPRATTDGGGRFELACRHTSATGRQDIGSDPMLVVLSGELATLSRLCKAFAGGTLDVGDLALEPGARLTGRVMDDRGRPIAGAAIVPWPIDARPLRGVADRAQDWGFDVHAGAFAATLSGADGRFRTGPLWNGSVQLAVTAPGFLEGFRDNVPVKVGLANDVGDLVLSAGVAITGVVRDAQQEPVAEARVLAWEARNTHIPVRGADVIDTLMNELREHGREPGVRTDAMGRFVVPNKPASNHSLLVDAEGFEPLRVDELLPGRSDVSLTLVRAATLRLTVLDAATRQPVASAVVQAWRLSGRPGEVPGEALPVRADEGSGAFVIERLGRTRTEVVISAPGYATASFALEGAVPPEARTQTAELVREALVTGRVTDVSGTPIASAAVLGTLRRESPLSAVEVHAMSDAMGRYRLSGLRAGEWALRADAADFSPAEQPVTLTLAEGQVQENVDLALPAAASVFGTCFSGAGEPEPGASFQFLQIDPGVAPGAVPPQSVRADADAHYELRDLRAGAWFVSRVGSWSSSGKAPGVEITLAPGERRELDLHAIAEARISGRVLYADGSPAPHAWVFAHATPSGMGGTSIMTPILSDESGHYDMASAYPGHFELVAAVAAPEAGMSPVVSFDLGDAEQRVVDLTFGTGSVRGRVIDTADEKPVAGAQVFALPQLASGHAATYSWVGRQDKGYSFSAESGVDGRFELKHLAPGRYSVGASLIGTRAEPLPPLVLGSGPAPEIEVRITRTGSLVGSAHFASGVPVKNSTIVSAAGPGQKQSALTEEGRFELKNLLPGSWQVSVMEGTAVLTEQSVTVISGQEVQLELIVP